MPYFLYQISSIDGTELVKNLKLLDQFDSFKDAKSRAKQLRADAATGNQNYKVMFAENQLSAEEQLQQKRDKPVLMEHER